MRWERGHRSGNVIDRRGSGGGGRRTQLGIGGILIVGVLSLVLGRDLLTPMLGGAGPTAPAHGSSGAAPSPADEEMVQFVSFVLDDSQATWRRLFAQRGQQYQDARLVLYTSYVSTACGEADSGSGPFYCPPDQQIYIDLSFYRELRTRFGAPGDFAQAYVLAHEVGHHVQRLAGTEARIRQQMAQQPAMENELSVRMELQADCYAGVWASSTAQRQLLDPGDVEEAMQAAQSVGDDTLQRRAGGRIHPESFTHGSSEQRARWFRQGYSTGQMESCDTFSSRI